MKTLAFAFCLLLFFSLAAQSHAEEKNVLIIFMDDLRPELNCYGRDHIKSPNIDALATAGVVFDRAYCQQALCGPSRISMMSGMYPHTSGIYDLWTPLTKAVPDAMSMPRYFKELGYETCSYGKVYHHTRDDKKSWTDLKPKNDVKYARAETLDGIEQRTLKGKEQGLGVSELRTLAKGPPTEIADVEDDAYQDGVTANQAIESLRRNKDKPFFMCVGFAKPHLPFSAPRRYWDLYQRDQFDVPDRALPADAPALAFTRWGELRNYRGMPQEGHLDDATTRKLIHGYAASVSYADAQVGKVIAELDRLGLRENTVVVLWGDHGYKLGDYGAWCKHTNLELDTHVPLIISAPGFAQDKRSNALVEIVDLFPTLAKLTGGEIPKSCDGKSLEPVLTDPSQAFRSQALSMYQRGSTMGYSLRTDRWRYTEWFNTKSKETRFKELYDHQSSPKADRNLANDAEHESLIAKLSSQLNSEGLSATKPVRTK
jgi:iduronate 2-sulfatase